MPQPPHRERRPGGRRFGFLPRRLAGAIPDLAICAAFAVVLADPVRAAGAEGTTLWRVAALEFFAVHASGFLKWTWVSDWGLRRRASYVACLAGGYFGLAGIAGLILGSWWPVTVFWSLTANRMVDAVVRGAPEGAAMDAEGKAWAGGVVLYVLVACVVGLTGMGRTAVLAGGAAYFLANGLSELTGWAWFDRWQAWSRRRYG